MSHIHPPLNNREIGEIRALIEKNRKPGIGIGNLVRCVRPLGSFSIGTEATVKDMRLHATTGLWLTFEGVSEKYPSSCFEVVKKAADIALVEEAKQIEAERLCDVEKELRVLIAEKEARILDLLKANNRYQQEARDARSELLVQKQTVRALQNRLQVIDPEQIELTRHWAAGG